MRVLVLDTIHGGSIIADVLRKSGNTVDAVDVYHDTEFSVAQKKYDLIVSPIHLNPEYLLLKIPNLAPSKCTHHEMVAQIIKKIGLPKLSIEITGARGKTTTAFAIAHLLKSNGSGILHTSSGTFYYPSSSTSTPKMIFKKSITPASLILVATEAHKLNVDWMVVEESLGVCGFGNIGVLTSDVDYKIAAETHSALNAKLESLKRSPVVIVPDGIHKDSNWYSVGDLVTIKDNTISWNGGKLQNPLIMLSGYKTALATATTVGLLLNLNIEKLSTFTALPGRMHLSVVDNIPILDNSNSGTNADNTQEATKYLRTLYSNREIILVIGMEHHAVCEGFSSDEIQRAIDAISPSQVIILSEDSNKSIEPDITICNTYDEAKGVAIQLAKKVNGSVLMAVKTWR